MVLRKPKPAGTGEGRQAMAVRTGIQKRVIQRVQSHMLEVEDMVTRGEDPWHHYRSGQTNTPDTEPPTRKQNVFEGMNSDSGQVIQPSGTTPSGGMLLGTGGTFSLGR